MVGINVFPGERIGDIVRIEAGAGIAYNYENTGLFASHVTLDDLGRIPGCAMLDGVGEGFAQGNFDVQFIAVRAVILRTTCMI